MNRLLIIIFLIISIPSIGQQDSTKSKIVDVKVSQKVRNLESLKQQGTSIITDKEPIDSKDDSSNLKKQVTILETKVDNTYKKQKKAEVDVDTTELELTSSETLPVPLNTNGLTKVVMVKEKSKFDFLRYLLPILTLFLGIWTKQWLDKISDKKRIKKSGERWIAELRSLEEPLKKQIESLEKFIENHKEEEFTIPAINSYSSLNGEIFKSLDKNELIKYIEMKNKKADFSDIVKISNRTHGYISILVFLHSSLKEKFEKFIEQSSKYTEALSMNLQSFGVAFAEYGIEIERETESAPNEDARYKPIADLYNAQIVPYLDDGKFIPSILKRDFFIPVLNILNSIRLDTRTKPLFISSSGAMNNIKAIQMEKQYINEIATTMIKRYKELSAKLNDIVQNIEKHKA
ncbi:hypothetical protein [Draconibacterium mangrovi]|uniref:hypothetical protein n=1 Tax=Draconibacterium mangrovi TaxID=2697469 RepID=UPI0013D78C70|nr:hypothetical protein [Draconibacterium mangrovi]